MSQRRHITARDLPLERDENGKPLCRWCKAPVKPPRRAWCGQDCIDQFLVRASGGARMVAQRRDKGVCALCGCDTERLKRILGHARRALRGDHYHAWGRWDDIHKLIYELGFLPNQSFWEADHIVPVVEGGGACGPENIRTLCRPCHKQETAALAKRRAQARRDAKRGLLDTGPAEPAE